MGAVVAGHGAVGGFGLNGLAIGRHQHRCHQAQRSKALRHNVRLHITIIVFACPDKPTLGFNGHGNHVINQAVFVRQLRFVELIGKFFIKHALENLHEAAIIGLKDGVFGGHIDRIAHLQPVIEAGAGKALNGLIQIIHAHGDTAGREIEYFEFLGFAAIGYFLGLALQRNAQLRDPRLAELAAHTWQQARRSAELARWLALELKLDAELCYTAGLLHNLGELALLRSLQDWQEAGGELSNEQIDDAMLCRSASFGSALRIRWRLPFGLRELIAALYGLGSGVFSREALVLNLTGLLLALPNNELPASLVEARCVRMLRLDPALLERVPVALYQAS